MAQLTNKARQQIKAAARAIAAKHNIPISTPKAKRKRKPKQAQLDFTTHSKVSDC